MPQLQSHEADSWIPCYLCRQPAAGPCASCHRSVCGDCCVLVDGAAKQWAICLRCEKKQGRQLSGWLGLGWFFAKILLGIVALIAVLEVLRRFLS